MSLDGLWEMAARLLPMPAGTRHRGWHAASTLCQAEIKRWETIVQTLTPTLPNGYCCSDLYAEAHSTNTENVLRKITGFSQGWGLWSILDFVSGFDLLISARARSVLRATTTPEWPCGLSEIRFDLSKGSCQSVRSLGDKSLSHHDITFKGWFSVLKHDLYH